MSKSNARYFIWSNGLQNLGDQIVAAKTVLPALFSAAGVPAFFTGLLTPIRESGSMLPQAALTPWVTTHRARKRLWIIGSLGQAVSAAVIALAAFFTRGAVLGVVATGVTLKENNTAADAFYHAAGEFGLRAFGMVLFAAGLSSVIGAAYTSVSFVTTQETSARTRNIFTVIFITVCTVIFVIINSAPQKLLIFAGAINGLILPIGFALVMWVAWRRKDLLQGYKYPKWLLILGGLAWLLTIFIGLRAVSGITAIWA